MDISKIQPIERTIEIKHPVNGANIGISVTLMSPDDERLKPVARAINDKALYLRQRNKAFTSAEIEENTMRLMVTTIISWNWHGKDVTFEGKKPDFTPENVRNVLNKLEWFRKQIDDELSETKSFFTQ